MVVRRRELVAFEFIPRHPAKAARQFVTLLDRPCSQKVQLDAAVSIVVRRGGIFADDENLEPCLFEALANRRVFRSLSRFDLPAGKLPHAGQRLPCWAAAR